MLFGQVLQYMTSCGDRHLVNTFPSFSLAHCHLQHHKGYVCNIALLAKLKCQMQIEFHNLPLSFWKDPQWQPEQDFNLLSRVLVTANQRELMLTCQQSPFWTREPREPQWIRIFFFFLYGDGVTLHCVCLMEVHPYDLWLTLKLTVALHFKGSGWL